MVWIGGDVLAQAAVDWEKLYDGIFGEPAHMQPYKPKPHQKEAIANALDHFKTNDRGKMIMACGTGKTITSLRIAEDMTGSTGWVLFLVPSIALMSQTLIEWNNQARGSLAPVCICSDEKISSRLDRPGVRVTDLMFRATTNVDEIKRRLEICRHATNSLKVVFSTYQSIDVVIEAQRASGIEFDLVVCDEAHRTTGLTYEGESETHFVKVHDQNNIRAKKRLYMTATPRIYSESSKQKAGENNIEIHSMDDESIYGIQFYYLSFGKAVELKQLSDYKVLVLTLSAADVPEEIQKMISGEDDTIGVDGVSKLVGCINALSKHIVGDGGKLDGGDIKDIMKRSVAFCSSIKSSKSITRNFNEKGKLYKDQAPDQKKDSLALPSAKHIDGTMSASQRNALLGWLKDENTSEEESRILTNVRCLSEGVDVPSLDAVMFLSDRNSQIDVVQSVGRVMRRAPGKKYGYIILPIVVGSETDPNKSLDTGKQYKVVWYVLNALRAHDERLESKINQIALNKIKPESIVIGGVDRDGDGTESSGSVEMGVSEIAQSQFVFTELQNALYAKMVQKVGDRGYFEEWARTVAKLADSHTQRISSLVKRDGDHKEAFTAFLTALRQDINPSVTAQQAVEMLAQHTISKPVFESLFEDYSFSKYNAVSQAMEGILEVIEASGKLQQDDEKELAALYDYVKRKVAGIDNAEGRQKVVVELYDQFFTAGFPKLVEQLGIVYTPVEVVDFIIHSVEDVLRQEFGKGLTDEGVSILDPFTGTGTFITRLLQSGLIKPDDLERKYSSEIFANEIVLLAYYIAAVNIENVYHDISESKQYRDFAGIVLADTFQMSEDTARSVVRLKENTERIRRQTEAPVRVIIGNPPYSAGQKSANDDAANQGYPRLHQRIGETYARLSTSKSVRTLYDSYIKAFRWSTDRLDPNKGGIIAFVSNGSWLDDNSKDGFRASLEKEFSSIYVFNLRGNQRTSGERSRREGGKVFGGGSRAPIIITLLVKKPSAVESKATICYHDIGDYFSREDKLAKIAENGSVLSDSMRVKWQKIEPNRHSDWINQRREFPASFLPINQHPSSIMPDTTLGITTNRDVWVYNFSAIKLKQNMSRMIGFYNQEVDRYVATNRKLSDIQLQAFTANNPKLIGWTHNLRKSLAGSQRFTYDESRETICLYRPYNKQALYLDPGLIERPRQFIRLMPPNTTQPPNRFIAFSGQGSNLKFSVLMSGTAVDMNALGVTRCAPLYSYHGTKPGGLLGDVNADLPRRVNVSDSTWKRALNQYGGCVGHREDVFYYMYGLLHSEDYRLEFGNNLHKDIPQAPLVENPGDFQAFVEAGRKLADLHINYEQVATYPNLAIDGLKSKDFRVEKMRFRAKDQKDTIIFNRHITISQIPDKAYDYVLNGKSAIEWVMDRYQIRQDKASGIINDPNDWGKEIGNPRYILDLLASVVNVSAKTVDIVNDLPKLKLD